MLNVKVFFRFFAVVFMILSISFSVMPVQAQKAFSQTADVPTGLSADDWAQIEASMQASSPSWQQAYLKASNVGSNHRFGGSVAVSGNTVVIGASLENSNAVGVNGNGSNSAAYHSGAVYVFVRNGATWSQEAYIKASNTEANDRFGFSVAISGDTIVVGAPEEDSDARGVNGTQSNNVAFESGAAYVFVRNGGVWSQQAYLKASNADVLNYFGNAVAISGDTIVVGAKDEASNATGVNGDDTNRDAFNSGAAFVFTRSGSDWSQQAYLKASNTAVENEFGYSVAIDADTIVVGAWKVAGEAGAAYVFNYSSGVWSQQAYLTASNAQAGDWFGYSVAISGDTLVVGAVFEADSGAAYVFHRIGSNWSQQAYLKGTTAIHMDYFASSLAISGEKIVVGANSEGASGVAYIFTRSAGIWSQQNYLTPSNADLNDSFGSSVGISGDTIIVGAPMESGDGTSQANNSVHLAGAGYVFYIPPFVVSSSRVNASPTGAPTVKFKVTFSESVTGVDTSAPFSDFALTTTGVTGASITSVIGSGNTYTVSVNTGSGNGTIRLDVSDDDSIEAVDTGTALGGAGTGNGDFSAGGIYTIANAGVISIARANPSPTNASSVNFTVKFVENVTGVNTTAPFSDFALTTTGITGAAITAINGSGNIYTVTVQTGIGKGTIRLDVVDDDSIQDTSGNFLGGAGAGNGNFTSGARYSMDTNPPTIVSIERSNAILNPTSSATVDFLVTFSEPITAVDAADFALFTPGITGAHVTYLYGSGNTRYVTVNTGNGSGSIRLDVPASATITDVLGNQLAGLPFKTGEAYTVKKTLTVNSLAVEDGVVLESSENSTMGGTLNSTAFVLQLGDDAANNQYRAILHFYTGSLPDTAVITKATLKMKKFGAVVGTDPFNSFGALRTEMRVSPFGTSSALELADFQGVGGFAGFFDANPVNNWYSLNLNADSRYDINRTGFTQFRLRFSLDDNNNHIADYVKFYSGDYPTVADRPTLVIEYYVP